MLQSGIEARINEELSAFLQTYHLNEGALITFEEFIDNKMLMITAIKAGIPYPLYETIQKALPFSDNDWADFLDLSTKTLQRYKSLKKHHFKSSHSEKIIELAEVTYYGLDVFGSMEKFGHWLITPNFALGRLTPKELLKGSYGKDLVMSELVRINYGILA
jgi:putative toxin-antitoxin system antitoxin component (TIGR02293 family)